LQEGCPINKERGNLFAIPLKKLKVKTTYKKQLIILKHVRGVLPSSATVGKIGSTNPS
jgi:hypothetical protein